MLGAANRGALEDRKLLADFSRQSPEGLDVEGQLGDVVRQRVDLQGTGLVAAQHEPSALVAHVDVGVDHAGDRELGPDPGDGLGDQELMARRHDGQGGAEPRGDDPRPRARASTTARVAIAPRGVRTPSMARALISNSVAGVCGSTTASSCSRASTSRELQ